MSGLDIFNRVTNVLSSVVQSAAEVISIPTNPYYIVETTRNRLFQHETIIQENGIKMVKVGEYYEGILNIKSAPDKYIRLFQLKSETDATTLFQTYKLLLIPLCDAVPKIIHVDALSKLCKLIREHPQWSVAHFAAKTNMVTAFENEIILKHKNDIASPENIAPIHIAIEKGYTDIVELLLQHNAEINIADINGDNVFHYAARVKKANVIQILGSIDSSGVLQLNMKGESPLHDACRHSYPANVEMLLRWQGDPGLSMSDHLPIHLAVMADCVECVGILIHWRRRSVYEKCKVNGMTPIHYAKSKKMINKLVKLGADIESLSGDSETPLFSMMRESNFDGVVALLSMGANAERIGKDGNSLLHIAVEQQHGLLVQCMIVFGAPINHLNDKKETARHIAAQEKFEDDSQSCLWFLHKACAERCKEKTLTCTEGCRRGGTFYGLDTTETLLTWPKEQIGNLDSITKQSSSTAHDKDIGSLCNTLESSFGSSTSMPTQGDKVLCLDGGGIRGILMVQVLYAIEKETGKSIQSSFDWIGGTSIGGILALGIAYGKSLREILSLYLKLKNDIFVGNRPYDAADLESFLISQFGENTKMIEITHPKIMLAATLADQMPPKLHLFRNYISPKRPLNPMPKDSTPDDFYKEKRKLLFYEPHDPTEQFVWKAARCSGAAPTYFRARGPFLDGGLLANNPTLSVLTEIQNYNSNLCSLGRQTEVHPIQLVLSLGTGICPVSQVKAVDVYRPEGLFDIARVAFGASALGQLLLTQATQTDGPCVETANAWCTSLNIPFVRISPLISEDVALDAKDDDIIIRMMWETECYIQKHSQRIRQIAKFLKD